MFGISSALRRLPCFTLRPAALLDLNDRYWFCPRSAFSARSVYRPGLLQGICWFLGLTPRFCFRRRIWEGSSEYRRPPTSVVYKICEALPLWDDKSRQFRLITGKSDFIAAKEAGPACCRHKPFLLLLPSIFRSVFAANSIFLGSTIIHDIINEGNAKYACNFIWPKMDLPEKRRQNITPPRYHHWRP